MDSVEAEREYPRCVFCNITAEKLPTNGKMIQSLETDAFICDSCIRVLYDLSQEGGEETEDPN